jgi:hypothetical protein
MKTPLKEVQFVNIHGDAVCVGKATAPQRKPRSSPERGFDRGFKVVGHKSGEMQKCKAEAESALFHYEQGGRIGKAPPSMERRALEEKLSQAHDQGRVFQRRGRASVSQSGGKVWLGGCNGRGGCQAIGGRPNHRDEGLIL